MTKNEFLQIVSRGFSLSWLLKAILRDLELPVRTVRLSAQEASKVPGENFRYGGVSWIVAGCCGSVLVLVPSSAFEEPAEASEVGVASVRESSSKHSLAVASPFIRL